MYSHITLSIQLFIFSFCETDIYDFDNFPPSELAQAPDLYEGCPESKDRLCIALAQVNELHHLKVNGPH
jgi:hypothetical protein